MDLPDTAQIPTPLEICTSPGPLCLLLVSNTNLIQNSFFNILRHCYLEEALIGRAVDSQPSGTISYTARIVSVTPFNAHRNMPRPLTHPIDHFESEDGSVSIGVE